VYLFLQTKGNSIEFYQIKKDASKSVKKGIIYCYIR
jgi:hypothetical protein